MAPEKNLSLIFKAIPTAFPVAGEHLVVEDVGFDPSTPAPEGGLVLENLYCSFDPYLRGRMRGPEVQSYVPGFQLGKPISSATISRVLKSGVPKVKEGAHVMGLVAVQQYTVLSAMEYQYGHFREIDVENGPKDIRDQLGAVGMPGLTAYSSLYEIGKPKKGETIFISSAAGAVGQIVGQLAKREGLHVIGSAGSDEKVKFIIDDLAFDSGFNYKTESAAAALDRLAPNGIDIYYENVGGEQLEAALDRLKTKGRIVACGMISDYNKSAAERYGVKNLMKIIQNRLTFRGFLVTDEDMMQWAPEHQRNVTKWLNDGSMKALTHETVGMEKAAEGCVGVFKGENFGKAVLKIKVVCLSWQLSVFPLLEV